jgi:hypothetical protein
MFKGLVLRESLKDQRLLKLAQLTGTEEWRPDNRVPFQPEVWTALYLEGVDTEVDEFARRLSIAIKRKWYANLDCGDFVYVVYSGRIFKYRRGDRDSRAAAQEYGRAVGIPESQLDWGE